ncbi:TfoX/Sxy family DNA transformation protein [Vibrio sp. 1180_3]|uniref:TfoX/Sxy family DNA transformation protein n=1 Tax=Vibrio sp. 1180_3 TaxID=2528832 RepID=UPI002404A56E|nr:TfoX/Sxy family DNA transformation protein [Vibrio sp. 1180_3]
MYSYAMLKPHFEAIGRVSILSMFGERGIFINGVMCALIAKDVVYLRTNSKTESYFTLQGCPSYSFCKKNHANPVKTRYYQLPKETNKLDWYVRDAYDFAVLDKEATKSRLRDQANMSVSIERKLASIGILTFSDLRHKGAVAAYLELKKRNPDYSEQILYKLQGAILGVHYSLLNERDIDALNHQIEATQAA